MDTGGLPKTQESRRRRIVETTRPGEGWRAFRRAKWWEVQLVIWARYAGRCAVRWCARRSPAIAGPCVGSRRVRIVWPGDIVHVDGMPQLWQITGGQTVEEWRAGGAICRAEMCPRSDACRHRVVEQKK